MSLSTFKNTSVNTAGTWQTLDQWKAQYININSLRTEHEVYRTVLLCLRLQYSYNSPTLSLRPENNTLYSGKTATVVMQLGYCTKRSKVANGVDEGEHYQTNAD